MNSSRLKKRSQSAAAGALVLAMMITASACGDSKQVPNNASNLSSPQVEQSPQGSGIIDSGTAEKENNDNQASNGGQTGSQSSGEAGSGSNSSANETDQEQVHTASGQYVGLQDSNQIEIITDNGAEAFRLTDEVRPAIETLEPDAKVEITYTIEIIEKDTGLKHLWLQSVKVIE